MEANCVVIFFVLLILTVPTFIQFATYKYSNFHVQMFKKS